MNYALQSVLAAILLLLLSPLMLLIALLYILLYGGGIIFRMPRIGRNERTFTLYKFRTMKKNCKLTLTPEQHEEWKKYGKLQNDTRLLPGLGRIMRRFSLDELPQLWNVVRGEMALVGPRPIIDAEKAIYGKYCPRIHSVKPGITGLWQVSGRNLLTYHRRVAINLYYVRHRSFKLDMWIIYRTVWAVLGGRGAF